MLRVKTKTQLSPIHGFGVFAAEPIAKGAVIWELDDGFDCVFTKEAAAALPPQAQEWLKIYAFECKQTGVLVACLDDARLMNHSPEPNAIHEGDGHYRGATIAARDIKPGEEITVDYFEFDASAASFLPRSSERAF